MLFPGLDEEVGYGADDPTAEYVDGHRLWFLWVASRWRPVVTCKQAEEERRVHKLVVTAITVEQNLHFFAGQTDPLNDVRDLDRIVDELRASGQR